MITTYPPDSPLGVFCERSASYSNINALSVGWEHVFADSYHRLRNPERQRLFKLGFAIAASGEGLGSGEYELSTGWDFDTEEEYRNHLRRLWFIHFPDQTPEQALREMRTEEGGGEAP